MGIGSGGTSTLICTVLVIPGSYVSVITSPWASAETGAVIVSETVPPAAASSSIGG